MARGIKFRDGEARGDALTCGFPHPCGSQGSEVVVAEDSADSPTHPLASVQSVASRHAFPTCRGRGRNHEGDLADWTGSILTDHGKP
jgi:hypothetical protein